MALSTFHEDLIANGILALFGIIFLCGRDLCKRIAHSDCEFGENGLQIKLPTWREDDDAAEL